MMEATLTIKLPDLLRRQARSAAAQRGQTLSEIVRRALQQYVEEAQVERKTLAAMYAEFAEEDRQLAQIGLAHYAHVLAQEQPVLIVHADWMEAENPTPSGSRSEKERGREVMQPTIMEIPNEEFEQVIREHINWAAEWDGVLPADVFFGAWADLQQEHKPVELQARLVEGRLEIQAPQKSRVRAIRDHVYLEDGRELVIRFEPAAQVG